MLAAATCADHDAVGHTAGSLHSASATRGRRSPVRGLGALAAAALLLATCGGAAPSSIAPSPGGPTASPAVAPTLHPTPAHSATPRPTARPAATPSPAVGPSVVVRHGSRSAREVALTFDMGGRVGDAVAIVTWLVDHGVHATLFVTGAMADTEETDAGRRVLATVQAHPELLTLGGHSYSHPDFRTLTAAEMVGELLRAQAAIAPYCSQDPKPFFRPPYGGYNEPVLAAVGSAGYRWTVLWDVDAIDWRPIENDPPGPTANEIVAKVLRSATGGSIVLMHLGGYETYKALPRVVDGLTDSGFDFVNLDQMLGG